MKTLLLVRHAKSSYDSPAQPDFGRTLNERGQRDAPEMARRLLEKDFRIDAFITSPAKRALNTCKYFVKVYAREEEDIVQKPELYLAPVAAFYRVIGGIDDSLDNIALFAHNDGITDFANKLTNIQIDNMPTCGIFAVRTAIDTWEEFEDAKKEFLFFDYPKNKS